MNKINFFYIICFLLGCFIIWIISAYKKSVNNYYGYAPKAPLINEDFDDCRRECNTFYISNYDENYWCNDCKQGSRFAYLFIIFFVFDSLFIFYRLYCFSFDISNWIVNNPLLNMVAIIGGLIFLTFVPFIIKVLLETGQGYIT